MLFRSDMNIAWINTAAKTVKYSWQGLEDPRHELTERFEREFGVSGGEDIGGLIVYSDRCVYDYENCCGWVR